MIWLRRSAVPFLAIALTFAALSPAVRAQTALTSARFAWADTTLLRDTLDLSFAQLFPLADSLRVRPDSLRSFSIRTRLPLPRLVAVADSLGMPVDSVGPVLEREQFNPLARQLERSTAFNYSSTYTVSRQSTSWGNSTTYDLVRGPLVFRNVTTVQIDRIDQAQQLSFHRTKTANTETGWKLSPDVAVGARVNLQRTENTGFNAQRATSKNDFQGSLHSKHDFGGGLHGVLDLFGGPFDEPRSSLSTASKRGLGSDWNGHIQYDGAKWLTFDSSTDGRLRFGHAAVPNRTTFSTRDLTWKGNGTFNLFPEAPSSLRFNYALNGDQTERPTSFQQIVTPPGGTTPDTTIVDQLVREPSGGADLSAGTQVRLGAYGQMNLTESYTRNTELLASERKEGLTFDRTTSHQLGFDADGQATVAGWSLDAQFNDSKPVDDSPRRSVVVDAQTSESLPVAYRERSTTRNRQLSGSITRRLTPAVSIKARGSVSLYSYRFDITDDSYLASTHGQAVDPSDPHDDYRQSYRFETTYARSANLSSTVALQVDRILTVYLKANRSGTNREDRPYRAEWLWSYQLLPGLTANQRNQIDATYSRFLYAPNQNRLSLNYLTITTLNATLTPHLQVDLTHNITYGPNGDYVRSADGLEYFNVSDASHDYTLQGRIAYSPHPVLTLTLSPYYQAHDRDDRTAGMSVPSSRHRELTVTGSASLNVPVGASGRLTGTLGRNLDSRRDVSYTAGVPNVQPRSETDYWSGQLQFSWKL